jgi:hypothetical protein
LHSEVGASENSNVLETPAPKTLAHALPSLTQELRTLLIEAEEFEPAAQVLGLQIMDRCRCGDDFCATFYTQPKPGGSYGSGHRNVALTPEKGCLILDVVDGQIVCVEILYRDDIRKALLAVVP